MPRKARNYKAEYDARQARAKTSGFKGYSDQRVMRKLAAEVLPGRGTAQVVARDIYALELSAGKARAKAGKPESFTDLLVDPKYGTIDLAHLRGQLSEENYNELIAMLEQAFEQAEVGKLKGGVDAVTLAWINDWLIEHDIDVSEWWAELYGEAA